MPLCRAAPRWPWGGCFREGCVCRSRRSGSEGFIGVPWGVILQTWAVSCPGHALLPGRGGKPPLRSPLVLLLTQRGGHRSASAAAPRQPHALPLGNSTLVLFSLGFLLSGKGQLLPSITWCPRNTPSFPDPSLVACSRLLPFLPGATRVPLQPHGFCSAAHMCRCCFDG